jgi:TonB family protein
MKPISKLISGIAALILSFPAVAQQPSPAMTQQSPPPQRIRVSGAVEQGLLVRKVDPVYPPLARQARISGTVVLKAIIGTDGSIENLTLVSGHPMLAPAAIDAVKQWKYKPFLVNGQPLKVETQVTVNFALSPSPQEEGSGGGSNAGQSGEAFVAARPEASLSQLLNKYPGLMTEFGQLLTKFQHNIQFPEARSESRLMPMLPESTIFYTAIPNYGEAIHQALTILQQELQQSPVLQTWWQQGDSGATGKKVEDSLERACQLSQYLGNEIVVSAGNEIGEPRVTKDPNVLILAEVRKPGLKDFLQQMMHEYAGKSEPAVRVLDAQELAAAKETLPGQQLTILVRPDLLIATTDLSTLRNFVSRLNAGSRAFAVTPFGRRLQQAYEGGTSIVGAIDLQKILKQVPPVGAPSRMMLERTGFADMKYLVWEHKSVAGQAASQMELSFTGPRQGVASWLAAPGPMGSLEFVSPKAMMAGAVRLKDPAEIFDDVKNLATASNPNAFASVAQMEQALRLSFKEDLFRRLSGELGWEVDNITPPNATWKVILGVNDPDRLQTTLNTLLATMPVRAVQSEDGGVTYHTLRIPSPQKMIEISYAFADKYLVIASSQEAITEAIRLRQSGESLSMSSKFLGSLPPGHGSDASALFYEDPLAVAAMSLRQALPEMAQSLSQSAAETSPAVITAYGEESAIREASRSGTVDTGAIMVVAAIAIPNLLRARIAANEASAVATIRLANTAQISYSAAYPQRGFAHDLATLGFPPDGGTTPSPDHASLIDATLGNATCTAGTWCTKSGFRFSVAAVCQTPRCEQFVVVGTPVSSSTGTRSFCSTSDAIVRTKNGPPLTSPVTVSECQSWAPLQ